MLCVLVFVLTKYMVQCRVFFVNNFVFIIFKTCTSSYKKQYFCTYSHTYVRTPAMGVKDHVSCEHLKKNGVVWCIDAYFKDICLNPFLFLFIDKY